MTAAWKAAGLTVPLRDALRVQLLITHLRNSYNRYLAVAARAVRRSLKDDVRLAAERRGQSDLKYAKWETDEDMGSQAGKQGEVKHITESAAETVAEK
ncbi:hypothetical protein UA08_08866 [Talaromyces atroroseus]|uniref:ATP synthase subunit epsilon, mitochondrial n=1 Tax=Talaromyces atroroseus TaxID=1441469 RepID=A0A225ALS1_TALAT|nr:hypothetical protein UA08_08866 [Talaromyces atroroseus]OKL55866.1 hypothetical protein UA08_08866 [Talaromyces atroroseus]